MEITVDISGRPAPQGSKKSIGGNRFIEASKYLPAWRKLCVEAAFESATRQAWKAASGPVQLEVVFYLQRPATISPSKRFDPIKPPDLSKLVRGIEDSFTGILYVDDAQIVKLTAYKHYADEREPGAFAKVTVL